MGVRNQEEKMWSELSPSNQGCTHRNTNSNCLIIIIMKYSNTSRRIRRKEKDSTSYQRIIELYISKDGIIFSDFSYMLLYRNIGNSIKAEVW